MTPGSLLPAFAFISHRIHYTWMGNKIDLSGLQPALLDAGEHTAYPIVRLSAKTGAGIELLRRHLKQAVGVTQSLEGSFIARRRHLDALARAEQFVTTGKTQLTRTAAGELLAEDLRQAQHCLAEITGEFSSDDLLGRIFAEFCIGK